MKGREREKQKLKKRREPKTNECAEILTNKVNEYKTVITSTKAMPAVAVNYIKHQYQYNNEFSTFRSGLSKIDIYIIIIFFLGK